MRKDGGGHVTVGFEREDGQEGNMAATMSELKRIDKKRKEDGGVTGREADRKEE